MAERNENQKAKEEKMPAGATNMHKNMAVGMKREPAEAKALTAAQVERKSR
jgi:hypothetical protein